MDRAEMGVATPTSFQNKKTYFEFLSHFETRNLEKIKAGVLNHFDASAKVNASHPINEAVQGIGYYLDIILPIIQSLDGFTRQNYIVLGGEYQGTEWVTSTGYFYGHFNKSMFGIPPSNKMAFLRFGEFHKMENGKIVETHVYLGLAELIIAIGRWPLSSSKGYEGLVPGPAMHDGVLKEESDPLTPLLMRLTFFNDPLKKLLLAGEMEKQMGFLVLQLIVRRATATMRFYMVGK
jgi:hypothetical protein